MVNKTQEALHKALRVLNCLNNNRVYETAWVKGAINACEEALAELQEHNEPFGIWHVGETEDESDFFLYKDSGDVWEEGDIYLYTSPPKQDSGEAVAYVYWENEEDKEVLVFEQISPERVVICLDYKKEQSVHVMKPNADGTVNSKVYTAPPKREWVGLSDEKIATIWMNEPIPMTGPKFKQVYIAIEQALKELNHE